MITVEAPFGRTPERAYVLDAVFGNFLGLEWRLEQSDRTDTNITLANEGGAMIVPDVFFSMPDADWKTPSSLPSLPLAQWDSARLATKVGLIERQVPVLYGALPDSDGSPDFSFPLDIFGSIFFMLTRYEEITAPVADNHDRFPASASLAHKAGFLDRPIVDEYVEILWAAMKHLWPGLVRKERTGSIKVSCDVDAPFDPTLRSAGVLTRVVMSDVLKRRSPGLAADRIARYFDHLRDDHRRDPFHTFDWYMAACDRAGLNAAFYFIPACSDPVMDGKYDIADPGIVRLIARLHDAGHEIGTHGSYRTYQDPDQMKLERERLAGAIHQSGREISVSGNRQHYLRWDSEQTPDHLDACGYQYDTTGSFADMPGFRYGTSKPFTMWSWRLNGALTLQQRPLVVMECSVIDEAYLALGYTGAGFEMINSLKARALQFGGDFTLLWHNSHFMHDQDREWFEAIIGAS